MNKLKLQTSVEVEPSQKKINYDGAVVFIGSCFSENIGNFLKMYKFDTILNPCGIVYNPLSVQNTLALVVGQIQLSDEDFVFHNELWHSMHHHGKYSHKEKNILEKNINIDISLSREKIKKASHIFITLGTAWVFSYKRTSAVVSNCHKLPSQEFLHTRMTIDKVKESLQSSVNMIREVNSTAEIVFTVSPIRHLKNGAHGNQLSKSTLLLGVDEIVQENKGVSYFPAYEIVLDELRDYRFFAQDMTHLSDTAVQYIWKVFAENYFTENTMNYFPKIEKLTKSLQHRIHDEKSEASKKFIKKTNENLVWLEQSLPQLNFDSERSVLDSMLSSD